nr:helix-turn-helix domain-containing protein [Prescottella equi]
MVSSRPHRCAVPTELGWSQEQAAHGCGVHWTYLGQVERGQRSPGVENLLKLSEGLRTTPGQVLDGLLQSD